MITQSSEGAMATLKTLRINLGWSQKDLAKAAGVNTFITSRAENGHRITAAKAKAIADAFSRAYGKEISVADIEGLDVE